MEAGPRIVVSSSHLAPYPSGSSPLRLAVRRLVEVLRVSARGILPELQIFYFEKIRVFKAGGLCLEYISMG